MKKCPQCQSIYTDDTLSYCLSDGTTLIFDDQNSEKTLQIPANAMTGALTVATRSSVGTRPESATRPPQESTVSTEKVSSLWLYSTIGLLLFLVIGGGIGIGFWLTNSNPENTKNSTSHNQSEKPDPLKTPLSTPDKTEQFKPSPEVQPTLKNTPKQIETATPVTRDTATPTPTQPPTDTGYRVVGVASHDVLYLRPNPGNLKSFLAKIPPNANGLQVIGGGVKVGKATWYPVIYNGMRGWVNGRFISK